ncbi:MAG: asparagine synthase (glutamine-hydrolyzing) [Actinomycetota bacterium]
MCGICGFIGPPAGPIDVEAARTMRDLLTHRGPDGAGETEIRGGGLHGWLGHRRLKILDLTDAARQPLSNDDGSVTVTYNGEIYNFADLRADLTSRGHRFRSSGDTEVVVRAYEEWGDDFIHRLDGMFAFALWDANRGRLILARDRTGKKPLYYTQIGGRLTFASEIKALRAAPWVRTGPDLARLPEFLTYGYVPGPHTLYEGVSQVPPGCTLTYTTRGIEGIRPYWDWPLEPAGTPADGDLAGRIAALIRDAVRRRMVSDVPIGALLSGGIDSSIVVGLMAQLSDVPVHTFSIGFEDDQSFDERDYARLVAERFSTHHTEFVVRADAVALLDTLLWHHDQPFADSSAIPTYLVCRLAREHVTVALNGDGGDEVFGGYDRFVAARISGMVPTPLARAGRRAVRLLPRSDGYFSPRRRAERFLERAGQPVRDRYQSWIAVLNEDLLAQVVPADVRALAPRDVTASMDDCYTRAAALPQLDRILYANFKTYLPDDLAVKMDRTSMANSLETRSPFLDTAVVECLARVRARHKVGLRSVKPFLRKAFGPLLPDEIWDRKKHGFGVPMGHWFRGPLGEVFQDEVLAADARTAGILDRGAVTRLWDEHRGRQVEHGFRLWTILTLERWLRGSGNTSAAPPPVAIEAS